jgi:hypothetical protein
MNGRHAREVRREALAGAITQISGADSALQHHRISIEACANQITYTKGRVHELDRRVCKLEALMNMTLLERCRWLVTGKCR